MFGVGGDALERLRRESLGAGRGEMYCTAGRMERSQNTHSMEAPTR